MAFEYEDIEKTEAALRKLYLIEISGLDILTVCGAVILVLKHPEYKGTPSADNARRITAQLTSVILDAMPREIVQEWRRVFVEGRDFDADDVLCLRCGNRHPWGARCEAYE